MLLQATGLNERVATTRTRQRLLEAAEVLFIEHGYEGLALRQITSRAQANLAAVNYHFGSKEGMLRDLLALRLEPLNDERLRLLDACEADGTPDCVTVLGILFVPALKLGREPAGGPDFLRLLGRVYSEPSPFIRDYLQRHYRPIFDRFLRAFVRALPELPRPELGLRLRFALKALSGVLAVDGIDELAAELSMGQAIGDAELLARLVALVAPALTAPLGTPEQTAVLDDLLRRAERDMPAHTERSRPATAGTRIPARSRPRALSASNAKPARREDAVATSSIPRTR